MKKKITGTLETFSKAMVQPLMYLSAAGILIVIGVLLTNSIITNALPFLQWGPIQALGKLIYNAAMAIINHLAVVFAIGIPAALAKSDKHKAALLGFMTYLMYLVSSNTLLSLTGNLAEEQPLLGLIGTGQAKILGIQCVDMSVFGGIILGCIVGWVFNRTSQKRFKGALQIFSGANYSYIWLLFTAILFALVTNAVWPVVQGWISALGGVIGILLGYVLSTVSVLGLFKFYTLVTFVVPVLALAVPLSDTIFAFCRRILHGQSPFKADRGHFHHKLMDLGLNQKQAVAILYAVSAILGLAAVTLTTDGTMRILLLLLALAIAISVWAYINKNIKHHPHEPDAHAGGQIKASNQKPSNAEQGESNEQAD